MTGNLPRDNIQTSTTKGYHMKLEPIQQLVLSKMTLPRKVRDQITPGEYEGALDVRLRYGFTVGEDYHSPVNAPWMKLLCVAFSKLNVDTQNSIIRTVLDDDIDDMVAEISKSVKERVASLRPERECKGKVTGKVFVTACEEHWYAGE